MIYPNYVKQSPVLGLTSGVAGGASLSYFTHTASSIGSADGSVLFDGIDDCLTVADNADFEFGSGNFTLEAFINYTGNPGTGNSTYVIFSKWDNVNSNKGFILRISNDGSGDNLQFFYSSDGSSNSFETGSTILNPGTWHHIAFVRNGSTGTFYIDGVADSTTHSMGSNSIRNTTVPFRIGANLDNSTVDQKFNGLISNVRVIKGTALYTSNFTVPTSLLAEVTNTKLLCCQSKTSVTAADVTPGTIVNNGGANVSTSNPFANAPQFGSVDFTGDPSETDYLNVAKSSDFDFSGVFTLEAWAYFDFLAYDSTPTGSGVDSNGRTKIKTIAESINWNAEIGQYHFGVSANNKFQFYTFDYPSSYENRYYQGNTTIETGQWYHFMVNRDSSNNIRLYVNGTRQTVTKYINGSSQGSSSYWNDSTALSNSNQPNPLRIGACKIGGTIYGMDGRISNLRMTAQQLYGSGSASTISVPTSELTTTSQGATASNVKLLCCQHISSATTATKSPTSITVNNTPAATSSNPFLNSSVYFYSSSLQLTQDVDLCPGTSDFTFECWLKPTNWGSSWETVYHNGILNGLFIGKDSSGNFVVRASSNTSFITQSTLPSVGQWTHIAVTRQGSTLRLFYNGVLKNSVSNSHNFPTAATAIAQTTAAGEGINGSISNLRFIKGTALYTSAFTTPVAPLTFVANTKLLCCNKTTVTGSSVTPTTITTNGNPAVTGGPF